MVPGPYWLVCEWCGERKYTREGACSIKAPPLTPAGRSYHRAAQAMAREVKGLSAFLERGGRTSALSELWAAWHALRLSAGFTFAAREAMSRVSPRVSTKKARRAK